MFRENLVVVLTSLRDLISEYLGTSRTSS